MSSDIEKVTVMDPRIVQSRPKYAVEKGALSVTNAPFNAIAASASQHTYNIYVPSENVFVDRKILWSSTVSLAMPVSVLAPPGQVYGQPICVPGRDFSLAALPLNQLCSTISATINDTTSVINSQDVLNPILRLTDYKANRLIRSAPTMLDKYQSYDDAFGTQNNPIGGYETATDYDNVPNGAFPNLYFTDPAGNRLTSTPPGTAAFLNAGYGCLNGIPVYDPALAPAPAAGVQSYQVYVQWRTTEPICLSPFIFSDEHEWETGLFGLNNIQLIMNFKNSPASLIRSCSRAGVLVGPAVYNNAVSGGASQVFSASQLNVTFLTPSLDVPLPPKSVVPYMEFPRYITQGATSQQPIPAGQVATVQSQTITLPQIPDLLIIYVKGSAYGPTDGDWYLPLATRTDGVANPLTINFDNFSGLLSSVTTEQLYQMSVHNGLNMDYATWLGQAHSASASWSTPATAPFVAATRVQGQTIATNGGLLILKPSTDITLQSGQAPSLVGNFTLQFSLQIKNNTQVAQTPSLYVITANSGFFESIRGSSRIIKGVLSEQDIISAPMASMVTRTELDRLVGAGRSFKSLGNVMSHMKSGSGVTGGASGAVGCGPSGGMAGAASGGRKGKSGLSARLM